MAANSKLIAVNVGLAAALALIAWQGRVRWVEAQAERHANLNQPIRHIVPPRPVPRPKPDGVQAAKYADVATKNLFSKDRNPTVIVEAPKVEPPKVMPPLPVVYGVLTLSSGTKAIMAEKSGASSKTVHAGDAIGDFKILAMDANKVTFEWDGKPLERNFDDLVDHSASPRRPRVERRQLRRQDPRRLPHLRQQPRWERITAQRRHRRKLVYRMKIRPSAA